MGQAGGRQKSRSSRGPTASGGSGGRKTLGALVGRGARHSELPGLGVVTEPGGRCHEPSQTESYSSCSLDSQILKAAPYFLQGYFEA